MTKKFDLDHRQSYGEFFAATTFNQQRAIIKLMAEFKLWHGSMFGNRLVRETQKPFNFKLGQILHERELDAAASSFSHDFSSGFADRNHLVARQRNMFTAMLFPEIRMVKQPLHLGLIAVGNWLSGTIFSKLMRCHLRQICWTCRRCIALQ